MIDSFIRNGDLPRYSIVRWNSRYNSICSALQKELGNEDETVILMEAKLLLTEVGNQLTAIQTDGTNILNVLRGFCKIQDHWKNSSSICERTKETLINILQNLFRLFSSSSFGKGAIYFIKFFGTKEFLTDFTGTDIFQEWAKSVLPQSRHDQYEEEKMEVVD